MPTPEHGPHKNIKSKVAVLPYKAFFISGQRNRPLDWTAVAISLRLGATALVFQLLLGVPLAYWLAFSRWKGRPVVEALVALPLVLPPTVLGFYLLLLFNPGQPLGAFWVSVTGESLTFNFSGLVVASILYSFPFIVQPLHSAFSEIGRRPLEAAALLRAGPLDAFFAVLSPLALKGYVIGSTLAFTHTLGEFGVVLMVGGSIPGETKTLSIAIYDAVETLDYASAHRLSLGLLVAVFLALVIIYGWQHRQNRKKAG